MRPYPAIIPLVLLAGACAKEAPFEAPSPPEPVYQIRPVGPNYQEGVPGQALANPFVVQVQDSGGREVAGVKVTWTIVSGRAALRAPNPSVTGVGGRSTMSVTPLTARVDVQASIQGQQETIDFLAVPHPSAIYDRISPASYCRIGENCESLAFYPDSTFGLRLLNGEVSGVDSPGGRNWLSLWFVRTDWTAAATVLGDSLFVSYNESAQLAGWEDGKFLLRDGAPPLP